MMVKRYREKRGLTQEVLAAAANLSRVYVAQVESGIKTPSLQALERLAKALKVKLPALLK